MRISDWSSDVCSSDLELADEIDVEDAAEHRLIPCRVVRVGDAGIVECAIKSAEKRNGLLDEGFDVGSLRYVTDNKQCVAARGTNLRPGFGAAVAVDVDRKSTRLNSSH